MDGCHLLFYHLCAGGHGILLPYFFGKNGMQRSDIQHEVDELSKIGNDAQKEQEKQVISYQKRTKKGMLFYFR